jgi:hypothetical protein
MGFGKALFSPCSLQGATEFDWRKEDLELACLCSVSGHLASCSVFSFLFSPLSFLISRVLRVPEALYRTQL